MMKLQDFDINDALAGLVVDQRSLEDSSQIQQEFGEEAYFEYS